jgi:hypothetical protein
MNDYVEFDLAAAKAGAPYSCRNGDEATVLNWGSRAPVYSLPGVRTAKDITTAWMADGSYSKEDKHHLYDLVMRPLGTIDGKPVFVGDRLVDMVGQEFTVTPSHKALTRYTWPEPPREYPKSQIDFTGFCQAMREAGFETAASVSRTGNLSLTLNSVESLNSLSQCLVNAIIKFAIDAEIVVPTEDVRKRHDLAKEVLLRGQAARDLAVAEAVAKATFNAANMERRAYSDLGLNLPAIIAKVPT